jgi:hypothetical protein
VTDTDPRITEVLLERLRAMEPGELLVQALRLSELAIRVSEAGVRKAHRNASDRDVFLRAAAGTRSARGDRTYAASSVTTSTP